MSRHSVLIKIAKPHQETLRAIKKMKKEDSTVMVIPASHNPVGCMINEPCIMLHSIPKIIGIRYQVRVKNIVVEIVHETIHHALFWLNEGTYDEENAIIDTFDVLFPTNSDMKLFFPQGLKV